MLPIPRVGWDRQATSYDRGYLGVYALPLVTHDQQMGRRGRRKRSGVEVFAVEEGTEELPFVAPKEGKTIRHSV